MKVRVLVDCKTYQFDCRFDVFLGTMLKNKIPSNKWIYSAFLADDEFGPGEIGLRVDEVGSSVEYALASRASFLCT